MSAPLLILFAKKPIPGFAKTRLHPHCSYEAAAQIALAMIEHAAQVAKAGWPGPIRLLVSPDDRHSALRSIAAAAGIETQSQSPGDLGFKMETAIQDGLASGAPVGLMGCDIPGITADQLGCAYRQLHDGANVLGPSADGGFYFIGTQRCPAGLLQEMRWSTPDVADNLISRAKLYGLRFEFILECLQDVDTWDDLQCVAGQHPGLGRFVERNSSSHEPADPISA